MQPLFTDHETLLSILFILLKSIGLIAESTKASLCYACLLTIIWSCAMNRRRRQRDLTRTFLLKVSQVQSLAFYFFDWTPITAYNCGSLEISLKLISGFHSLRCGKVKCFASYSFLRWQIDGHRCEILSGCISHRVILLAEPFVLKTVYICLHNELLEKISCLLLRRRTFIAKSSVL